MTPEQLKASILQYAVEGKLVKQDSNDEPASELLKKIENEKDQLIEEGKIKRSRKLSAITDEEKPFNIPDSWEWVRLGNIFDITSSKRVMKKEWRDSGIPFYRAREIVSINKNRPLKDPIFIDEDTYLKKIKISGKPNEGDILLTGVGTLGIPYIVPKDKKFYFKDGNIIWLKNFGNLNSEYLSWYVQCPYMLKIINDNRGTTVGTLTIVRSKNLVIPIPPLEEQKRIVAKIEKLMPLVDEYAESYNRLQKIDNEFEDKLKQSVLQYAMEGKLVKQNPSDEPASELIKKIENEKAELVKEGKIKKSKKLPAITDDEKPFDIPDSWEWVRLKQITTYGNFNSIKGSSIPDNSWVVDMKDVRKNGGGFSEIVRRKSTDIYKSNKYSFNKNAVLYGKLRPYLRKVEIAQTSGFTTTEMLPINVVDLSTLVPQYLRYAMLSPYFVNLVNDSMYGMKMPRVGTTFLAKMVVPLPPLEEQKRIVEKVEELQSSISNLSK
ncbi:type I restriction endonuclease [Lactobacillus sp. UMNPBX1]|uniref:restriction endonuclease subunit S n=1 Tax=Lactobacillus sp. UMNPBX1 TaxID=2042046 RepID=UPI000BEEF04E|nr:restriction endonuclease subunit S [Lactobacillus sp. UMNPBX1]PEH12391.1 type I restriction endonuclease [Lactobacillus sp. UMNPBX1]